ncbi:hypothetical protein PIB30_080953 [Stylosanthes scabra]|uniref:Pentatricopeptide repeat-containing protein n=1 Tax=Stylosanthes scabra TaxID=79078 RepID=A0ABU6TUE7_9FABA|nr:hypothetical protein [Stylosanthes scabra]
MIHLVDSTYLTWAYSISSTAPIMNSTKFLKRSHNNTAPNQPFPLRVELMKRGSKPLSSGIQKDSNKDLSRILRTEAAIKGVENKGKSWKHRQLWPKAVLEALDEAIKGCRWQTALKAAGMFEDMENTLADMVESGNCQPDVFTLNSIIGAYGKGRKFDKMETWYDEF